MMDPEGVRGFIDQTIECLRDRLHSLGVNTEVNPDLPAVDVLFCLLRVYIQTARSLNQSK